MATFTIVYDKQEFGAETKKVEAWDGMCAVGKAMDEFPPDETVFQVYCAETYACGVLASHHNPKFNWELYRKKKADLEWAKGFEARTGKKWDGGDAPPPSQDEAEQQRQEPVQPEEETMDRAAALKLFGLADSYTSKELRKAYGRVMKENHPDRVADMAEPFRKMAEANAKRINQANELLQAEVSEVAS
jgi:hypothetical protein